MADIERHYNAVVPNNVRMPTSRQIPAIIVVVYLAATIALLIALNRDLYAISVISAAVLVAAWWAALFRRQLASGRVSLKALLALVTMECLLFAVVGYIVSLSHPF